MGGIMTSTLKNKEDAELKDKIGLGIADIQLIVESWQQVKRFGVEEAGIILFKRLFIVAPETFLMFREFCRTADWENCKPFKHHCKVVMNIIGSAVGLLRNPDSLDSTLEYIGLKHFGFGITAKHFDLLAVELISTLREILGILLTSAVEAAWTKMYGHVVKVMSGGMRRMESGLAKATDQTS